MAFTGLLALLDDITTLLDDVSVMSQLAAKKTAGVLGDDLALNAQQVAGVHAERELPVVWAVAKGSLLNKAILVPSALMISAVAALLITPLLMLGGAFLCFEGFEKVWHRLFHGNSQSLNHASVEETASSPSPAPATLERDKIRGAIRTDFILSAEIIVISLGVVAEQSLMQQSLVLVTIALLMTVGVYGLVAAIVKLDDAGLWLWQSSRYRLLRDLGAGMVRVVPYLMRLLTLLGTAAMFLVGGSIVGHGVPAIHHWTQAAGGFSWLLDGIVGVVLGGVCLLLVQLLTWVKQRL